MNATRVESDISKQILSVVIPVFNEATIIPLFHQELKRTLQQTDLRLQVIYVNDGSVDNTLLVLEHLREHHPEIAILDLSRNFGKEIALQAGLDHAIGDAVVVMDVDLQDPPSLITDFIHHWRKGYDVVYATRLSRKGESAFKKISAFLFYRLMSKMSNVPIPKDTGDFRLLSKRAVQALTQLREKHRYMKGLFAWIGYPQISIPFERPARMQGESKWNTWKLFNLAMEGITSFSFAPLKVATVFGFSIAAFAFFYAVIIMYKTFMFGEPIRGYPSLMVVILFLGGVQLITLGIMGEYLGRTFDETKQRPLYFIKGFQPALGMDSRAMRNSNTSIRENSLPAIIGVTK